MKLLEMFFQTSDKDEKEEKDASIELVKKVKEGTDLAIQRYGSTFEKLAEFDKAK